MQRRKYSFGPLTAVWCVSLLLISFPAQAASLGSGLGLNVHLLARYDPEDRQLALEELTEVGPTWVREQFTWGTLEPSDDAFEFEAMDEVINGYVQNDFHVLGLLTYTAPWASLEPDSDDARFYPAQDVNDWLDFVNETVIRYAGQVEAWEIWNEPNHPGFWKSQPDAQEYAEFLELTAEVIHSVDPQAKVVMGGLSAVDTDFLHQIYEELDEVPFDVVAFHPYREAIGSQNWTPEESEDGLLPLVNQLSAARAVMHKHQDDNTPIWLTEFGWTTGSGGVTEQQQKQYLARQTALALSIPKVQKVFWYAFRDGITGDSLADDFGITDQAGQEKPAAQLFRWLKKVLGKSTPIKGKAGDVGTQVIYPDPSAWQVLETDYASGSAEASDDELRMQVILTGKENSYVIFLQDMELPSETKMLSFVAQGSDLTNCVLRFRVVDSQNEIFQYTVGSVSSDELRYQHQLSDWDGHFGGDADGELDQPLRFQSFILDDSPDSTYASGQVSVSALRAASANDYLVKYTSQDKQKFLTWTTGDKHLVKVKLNAKKIRYRSLTNSEVKTSSDGVFTLLVKRTPQLIVILE